MIQRYHAYGTYAGDDGTFVECLRDDLLTRDIAEVIAEYSAEPVSDE